MHDQPSPLPRITVQGIALVDLVIDHIRRNHPTFQAVPLTPEAISPYLVGDRCLLARSVG
jgi:hypothetical protein